ncbi:MAG: hypothetical protein Q9220_003717 [cf. Caloplaca sp. 1 TL-2023]
MAAKRKLDAVDGKIDESHRAKISRKGFSVGPANLPDGTYLKKIKDDLIRKAKVKKSYSKIKGKEPVVQPKYYSNPPGEEAESESELPPASMELHPARQAMLEEPAAKNLVESPQRPRRPRKPKRDPFKEESSQAISRNRERDEKRAAIEQAHREKQQKFEERERFRKAMAKARTGGKNGQRKLGRESKILLERVKNLVAEEDG